MKTCAVCGGYTYDADPLELRTLADATSPPRVVRLWLCSSECAWKAGAIAFRVGLTHAGSDVNPDGPVLTLAQILANYDAGGVDLEP
jgi:hypothetical protein